MLKLLLHVPILSKDSVLESIDQKTLAIVRLVLLRELAFQFIILSLQVFVGLLESLLNLCLLTPVINFNGGFIHSLLLLLLRDVGILSSDGRGGLV